MCASAWVTLVGRSTDNPLRQWVCVSASGTLLCIVTQFIVVRLGYVFEDLKQGARGGALLPTHITASKKFENYCSLLFI